MEAVPKILRSQSHYISQRSATVLSNHLQNLVPCRSFIGVRCSSTEKRQQNIHKNIGTFKRIKRSDEKGMMVALRSGAPFVLFSLLAAWVVSNAVDGKLKEMEAWQGKSSMSIRQAKLESEHEEMMERLNKIVAEDFDNTKRIKRPQEILEERRLERERRNRWHRRLYRWTFRIPEESELDRKK